METELEVEYKALLTKEDYDRLHEVIPTIMQPVACYVQTNYFFDTKEMTLHQKGITLRLREKNGTWQLTAKIKQGKKQDVMRTNLELNESIAAEQAVQFCTQGIDPTHPVIIEMMRISQFEAIEPLHLLGHLQTERTDYLYEGETVSLDCNTYNGQTDYEIEWESVRPHVVQVINATLLHVDFSHPVGKRKRFLASRT